ncbi:MAG: MFS transporter [Clostridia bacterium]|nr:MFS transporter [Clostridia bacterium]
MVLYRRAKWACYASNVTAAVTCNVTPLLFLTFRSLYGISYTKLGLLVLVNFLTQLTVDLIFSFFSHKFNIKTTVRLIPVIAFVGLWLFALTPWLFPSAPYVGLVLATVVFSSASGLGEVLISPVVAAIPAKNPEREMSKLHAVYAWGAVGVILLSALYIFTVSAVYWQYMIFAFSAVPLVAALLFFGADLPDMQTPGRVSGALAFFKRPALWVMFLAIFLGGSAECSMSQWCSGYLEGALGIPKILGDMVGVAMFSLTLGLGRTLYAKYGKNIETVLFLGGLGASVCYLLAALSPLPLIGLAACALTGFCVSMLWPGCLVAAEKRIPSGGVFLYAMMASGGDLGASVGPQLLGAITDAAMLSPTMINVSERLGLSAEQCGMRLGMMVGAFFPICATAVYFYLLKTAKNKSLD